MLVKLVLPQAAQLGLTFLKEKPVANNIKFTTSFLRHHTELSRDLWMLSTDTSFDLYDGVKTTL